MNTIIFTPDAYSLFVDCPLDREANLENMGKLIPSLGRHQMETFSALLAVFAGNSPVTSEFPSQRPVTRNFDVFLDLRLNNRLSKQS